jgi:PAS domain S-box-containing protein
VSRSSLDAVARSDEAVFAIDRTDRIVVWNHGCEELLGYRAKAVLGKLCFEVMGGRDLQGNLHCYENCPVVHQIRRVTSEPLRRFPMRARTAWGAMKLLSVSAFLLDGHDPELGVIVHVIKEDPDAVSAMEARMHRLDSTGETRLLAPLDRRRRELTTREKEILRLIARGIATEVIAKELCIAPVTVRNHVRSILQKLGVHTKFAAVAYAFQNNVV